MRFTGFAARRLGAALLSGCAALALPAVAVLPLPVVAQEGSFFVQIAARPTLREGEEEARRFAARVAGVNGFAAPGGWYVVALGPYSRREADDRLGRLRAEGRIPGDSFIVDGGRLRSRFYPVGADRTEPDSAIDVVEPAGDEEPLIDFEGAAALLGGESSAVTDSAAEARASEALLSAAERDELQVALAASGFYDGPIDGDFGRGTRSAMAAWQAARGMDPTGILTTAQRASLLLEFNAVFDGLGLRVVRDEEAGIDLEMPTAVVAFEAHETPFARYEPTGAVPEARVILLSQEGGRNELAALYEIMQTLAIVPPDGPRERSADGFDIEGRNGTIVSRTHAVHRDGRIKGFTLVWPAGDTRFERLSRRMRDSFDPSPPAVLGDRHATRPEEQDIDLLAGLDLRRPDLSRSGFFVDTSGRVLTTAEIGADCRKIRLDDSYEALVAWTDGPVTLLEPTAPLAPSVIASFAEGPLRLGEEIALGGYPCGGLLGRASVTFGRLADLRGLGGEAGFDRYDITSEAMEAGGPVVGPDGAVAGMLLPAPDGRVLPPGVAQGVDAATLREALRRHDLEPAAVADDGPTLAAEDLVRLASGMSVQVGCYR